MHRPEWDSNPRIADLQSAPSIHKTIVNIDDSDSVKSGLPRGLPTRLQKDADLDAVVAAWPNLTPAVRKAIAGMASAAVVTHRKTRQPVSVLPE